MTTTDPTLPEMRRYTGTKTLLAAAMTRGDYNAYRGWTPPEGEDQEAAGYIVEYKDGGAANDSRHTGYISWSPAAVFEMSYRPSGTWQERIRLESAEMAHKVASLHNDDFSELDLAGQQLVQQQRAAMLVVLDILRQREALLG